MRLVAWLIILATSGCGRSVVERVDDVVAPTLRYRVAAEASHWFAAYLYALDEPSFEGIRDSSLRVRLVIVTDEPKWVVIRINEAGAGAEVYLQASDRPPQRYGVPAASWRAFQDTLAAVNVWAAPWRSLGFILDGWSFGLEVREGDRHRALWLVNPDQSPDNEGFMRLVDAIGVIDALAEDSASGR
jgi:hypothetical protein